MITGIILASGFSNRMGEDKLLLEVQGKRVVERVIEAVKESNLDEILLIYRKKEIKSIGEKYNIKTIHNPNAKLGQSESVKKGVACALNSEAYMFIVGDQPYLNSNVINKLINEYKVNKDKIIIPFYNEELGMPIIFPGYFREKLLKVKGDKGGHEIIDDNPNLIKKVNFSDWKLGFDIDTKDDLYMIEM